MKPDDIDLYARVPPELEAVHIRLENWARWSKDRPRRGRCASLEGLYRSPQIWEPQEPRMQCDPLDAEVVFGAVRQIPEKNRWALAIWYIYRAPEGYMRRKLALPRDKVVTTLNASRKMVDNILSRMYKHQ